MKSYNQLLFYMQKQKNICLYFVVLVPLLISVATNAATVQNSLYSWNDPGAPAYKALSSVIPTQYAKSFSYSFQMQASNTFIIGATSNTYCREIGSKLFDPSSLQYITGTATLVPAQPFYTNYQYPLSSIIALQLSSKNCLCITEECQYNGNGTTNTGSFTVPGVTMPTPGVLTTYLFSISLTSDACSITLDYLDTSITPNAKKNLVSITHAQLPASVWNYLKSPSFQGFTDIGFRSIATSAGTLAYTVQNTKISNFNGIDMTLAENVTSSSYPWDDTNSKNLIVPIPTDCSQAFKMTFRANPNINGFMGIGLYSKNYCSVNRSSQDDYGYVVKAKDSPLVSSYPNNFVYPLSAIIEYIIGDCRNTTSILNIESASNRSANKVGAKITTLASTALIPLPGVLTQFIYTVITSPQKITVLLEYINPQTNLPQEIIKLTETQFGLKTNVADYIRSPQFTGFTDIGFIGGAPFTVKDITISRPAEFITADASKKNARDAWTQAIPLLRDADTKAQEVINIANQLINSNQNKDALLTEAKLLRINTSTTTNTGTQATLTLATNQVAAYSEQTTRYDSINAAVTAQQKAESDTTTALTMIKEQPQTLKLISDTLQKIINAANAYTATALESTRTSLITLQTSAKKIEDRLKATASDIAALPTTLSSKSTLAAQAESITKDTTAKPATGIAVSLDTLTQALAKLPANTSYQTVSDAQDAYATITNTAASLDAMTRELSRLDTCISQLEDLVTNAQAQYQAELIAAAQAKAAADAAAAKAAADKAEADRIAAEKAKQDALAADKAAQAKAAADAAAAKAAADKAEADRIAAEKAKQDALAADKAAQDTAAADATAKAAAEKPQIQSTQPLSKIDEALSNCEKTSSSANALVEKTKKLPSTSTSLMLKNTAQSLKINLDDMMRKLTQAQKSLTAQPTRSLSASKIQSNVRTIENYAKTALSLIKQRQATLIETEKKVDAILGTA